MTAPEVPANDYENRVNGVAALYEANERADIARMHPGLDLDPEPGELDRKYGTRPYRVQVTHRRKYSLIDFGGSGKFMIERETEQIFGIKRYGQVHKGHRYGTLSEPKLPRRVFLTPRASA